MPKQLIECVPNFSEGRDLDKIRQITEAISSLPEVRLLDVDPGAATNRTVVTFVGEPRYVLEAAFRGVSKAAEIIDMSKHQGEHPRMGATDVCPLIPISGISMEEVARHAADLAKRVGQELGIPVYLYESAATSEDRINLAMVRAGEYEGLEQKLADPNWQPDFGPARFNSSAGATAIGARDFLIAYNVNLNTTSSRRANSVAFDIREQGRVKRSGNPMTGPIVRDKNGEAVRIPGECQAVKAIGWYIEEYGIAQISMNLIDVKVTPLHMAFEACRRSASRRGMRVTGSELVGMVPLDVLLSAGTYFLRQQQRSVGVNEREIIKIAVKSLGLDELAPFDPDKKIIEYALQDGCHSLTDLSLVGFADQTASESPAPGGGSVAAYLGALAAALGTMVANLSAHKRGWDEHWETFSHWAVKGQALKDRLLELVHEDTRAFNDIIVAIRLPKGTPEEQNTRLKAIEDATKNAVLVPLDVMKTSVSCYSLLQAMAESGNPNSSSDAGVGALACHAAVRGAWLNVKINLLDLEDTVFRQECVEQGERLQSESLAKQKEILDIVEDSIAAD